MNTIKAVVGDVQEKADTTELTDQEFVDVAHLYHVLDAVTV